VYVLFVWMCCSCSEFVNVVQSLSASFGGFQTWSLYWPISLKSLLKSPSSILVCVLLCVKGGLDGF
jgi:hypothetical protein